MPSLNIFQHELGWILLFLLLVLENKSWFLLVWLVWQTLSPPCHGHVGHLSLPNDTWQWQWHHRITSCLSTPLLLSFQQRLEQELSSHLLQERDLQANNLSPGGVKSGRKTVSCWLSGQICGQILTSQFIKFNKHYGERTLL